MTLQNLSDNTTARLEKAGLDPAYVLDVVTRALLEDLDGGVDVTSVATVPPGGASPVSRPSLTSRGDRGSVTIGESSTVASVIRSRRNSRSLPAVWHHASR